ncbi:MAG: GYD domain-containing protein, partial [Alphaproteobacteria bacterium]|nr:GYD domain-containing protein [Alphaproteobacteria bacterium]
MRYVVLGSLGEKWATKQAARTGAAKAKLKRLGIKLVSVHYTQGPYDFVDVLDAPNAEAMLAFSVWYANKGFG